MASQDLDNYGYDDYYSPNYIEQASYNNNYYVSNSGPFISTDVRKKNQYESGHSPTSNAQGPKNNAQGMKKSGRGRGETLSLLFK